VWRRRRVNPEVVVLEESEASRNSRGRMLRPARPPVLKKAAWFWREGRDE
jgi:hypothetical protein